MSFYFGLYFGDTNLCLAVHREGNTEVLANSAGDRVTPAFVAFANGEKLVGLSAKQGLVRNANNTLARIKTVLGGDDEEIEDAMKTSKCKMINENGNFKYEVIVEDKVVVYRAYDALVSLFKNMAMIAKSACHEDDIPVVITVPLKFKQEKRETVALAASEAGFRLLRIISEPAASLLAYDIAHECVELPCYSVVFRMGGTSLDVTVIEIVGGMYRVLAHVKDSNLGGFHFTELISEYCSMEFKRQYKTDIRDNSRSAIKLHVASETCKHVLSTMGSAQCFVESVHEGIDLSVNVSRARFESLINPWLPRCLKHINIALEKANLQTSDISELVLAGGSCKIPKLQQALADMFPNTSLRSSISSDEVIAVGASKQANLIEAEDEIAERDCFINTLTYGIYMKVIGKETSSCIPLFSKSTPIPVVSNHEIMLDKEPSTVLEVYEVRSENDRKVLAEICIPCRDAKKYTLISRVEQDGTLHLKFTDDVGNTKVVNVIHSS